MNRSVLAFSLTALGSCAHVASHQPTTAPSPLELRADSLIWQFVDLPGEFSSDGHVYTFFTDQQLVDDIVGLELHAVPSLIGCMGNGRLSKVTFNWIPTGEIRHAPVGALCNELLHRTYFAQLRDDSLFKLAIIYANGSLGVGEDGEAWYYSTTDALRRAQRVWRAYFTRYSAVNVPARPALARTAVGCYTIALHRTKWDLGAIDTSRKLAIRLDTLPLPYSVRPQTVQLASNLTLTGVARWHAHYDNRVLVSWRDSTMELGINFGGSDSAFSGFQLVTYGATPKEVFGGVTATRTRCSDQSY